MERVLFQDLPKELRFEMLRDNADAIEEIGYMKAFEGENLESMKEELVNATIEASELELELKAIQEDYKNRMAPLKKAIALNAKYLKEKAEFVKEQCYKMIDHNNREVGYYNSLGELVSQRPARPDESQRTIHSINRTGTNN